MNKLTELQLVNLLVKTIDAIEERSPINWREFSYYDFKEYVGKTNRIESSERILDASDEINDTYCILRAIVDNIALLELSDPDGNWAYNIEYYFKEAIEFYESEYEELK